TNPDPHYGNGKRQSRNHSRAAGPGGLGSSTTGVATKQSMGRNEWRAHVSEIGVCADISRSTLAHFAAPLPRRFDGHRSIHRKDASPRSNPPKKAARFRVFRKMFTRAGNPNKLMQPFALAADWKNTTGIIDETNVACDAE